MPKLRNYVHVADENGVAQVFGPDDDVPEWAVKAITNPKAWADEEPEEDPAPKRHRTAKRS